MGKNKWEKTSGNQESKSTRSQESKSRGDLKGIIIIFFVKVVNLVFCMVSLKFIRLIVQQDLLCQQLGRLIISLLNF